MESPQRFFSRILKRCSFAAATGTTAFDGRLKESQELPGVDESRIVCRDENSQRRM